MNKTRAIVRAIVQVIMLMVYKIVSNQSSHFSTQKLSAPSLSQHVALSFFLISMVGHTKNSSQKSTHTSYRNSLFLNIILDSLKAQTPRGSECIKNSSALKLHTQEAIEDQIWQKKNNFHVFHGKFVVLERCILARDRSK